MQVYGEINIDLKKINFDIETNVLKLMTKGVEVNDYEKNINILIDRIKKLQLKKSTIIQELDLLFIEDKSKYERGKKLWLSAIEIAFTKVCYNFQDGSLTKDILNNDNLFFQSYMQVYSKVYYAFEADKIEITDCGIFYAYTLYEIKNEIKKRETELLPTIEMKDRENKIDLSNKEYFPVFHSISGFLNKFITLSFLDTYWAKRYEPIDGEVNVGAETEEQRNKDINRVIGVIKGKLLRMKVESPLQRDKLKFERDNYSVFNMHGDDKKDFIKFYNQQVIKKIENFIKGIIYHLECVFNPFFSEANKNNLLTNKSSFSFFYEVFGDKIKIAENSLNEINIGETIPFPPQQTEKKGERGKEKVSEHEAEREKLALKAAGDEFNEEENQSGENTAINFTKNNFNPNQKSVQEVTTFFTEELKHYADEITINKFLYSAFQKCIAPEQKYSLNNLTFKKSNVKNVFNNFYNKSGKMQGDATKYAGLLGDYFIGFTTSEVAKNWTVIKKPKRNS